MKHNFLGCRFSTLCCTFCVWDGMTEVTGEVVQTEHVQHKAEKIYNNMTASLSLQTSFFRS